jgi:hypothetical protein
MLDYAAISSHAPLRDIYPCYSPLSNISCLTLQF